MCLLSGRGFYVDGWGLFRYFRDFFMFGRDWLAGWRTWMASVRDDF